MKVLRKIDNAVYKTVCIILTVMMMVIAATSFGQVIARYVFSHSFDFVEELCRYLFIGIAFLGMIPVTRDGKHISIDIIFSALPLKVKRIWNLFLCAAAAVFCILFARSGWLYAENAFKYNQLSTALQMPMWIPYSPMIIGPAVAAVYFIVYGIRKYIEFTAELKAPQE